VPMFFTVFARRNKMGGVPEAPRGNPGHPSAPQEAD